MFLFLLVLYWHFDGQCRRRMLILRGGTPPPPACTFQWHQWHYWRLTKKRWWGKAGKWHWSCGAVCRRVMGCFECPKFLKCCSFTQQSLWQLHWRPDASSTSLFGFSVWVSLSPWVSWLHAKDGRSSGWLSLSCQRSATAILWSVERWYAAEKHQKLIKKINQALKMM